MNIIGIDELGDEVVMKRCVAENEVNAIIEQLREQYPEFGSIYAEEYPCYGSLDACHPLDTWN